MIRFPFFCILAIVFAGCATVPAGPTITVMPAPNMPFQVFQQDDMQCREYALRQLGAAPGRQANQQVATGAVAGAAVGATAGAIVSGGDSRAVNAGAANGLLFGTLVGAGNAAQTNMTQQQRYNLAYAQCMYAKGNQVPGYAAPGATPQPPPPPGVNRH